MIFQSILFEKYDANAMEYLVPPSYFYDLHLDTIVEAITLGKENYRLKPLFYTPVKDVTIIKYRHSIMQDIETDALFVGMQSFSNSMQAIRSQLIHIDKIYYELQKELIFIEVVNEYCKAVTALLNGLDQAKIQSNGLHAFRNFLKNYTESNEFTIICEEEKRLRNEVSRIKYLLIIKDSAVTVQKYKEEPDYSDAIEETFVKFKLDSTKEYLVKFSDQMTMNHVEAKTLEFVALLYPDVFHSVAAFSRKHENFFDDTIDNFDREVQFYISYLEYIKVCKEAGLKFCYPEVSSESKNIYNYEGFDIALASKLIAADKQVVCNDFYLRDEERIFVVSGPNQSGKTTFARSFGQLHHLASLGCPVPGREAQLFMFDRMFTHFEKKETIENLHGKLQDDLIRIHNILYESTQNSIVIINEIFSSTTLSDALLLGEKIVAKISMLDLLCVIVTFVVELSSFDKKTVSLVSAVDRDIPTLRTYKLMRMPADGISYALSIAKKYKLTFDDIMERIGK